MWFDEIDKESGSIVGGKAANLGEMVKLKLPVPPGFVVNTKAFNKFLLYNMIKDTIQRLVKSCDVDNTEKLLKTSKKIKDLIIAQDIPPSISREVKESYERIGGSVAVRSSATAEDLPTASFAGQFRTFLNVRGEELVDVVKKCWASLYEPRAIFYRSKQGFTDASIAVIVQEMVESEKAGVMFTVNPTTGEDEILIEAVQGLGEKLVSGQVNPDKYVVKDGEIREKTGKILIDKEIKKLAEYGKRLEQHYGIPQDIEFAIEKDSIYIVQTRAVTTEGKMLKVKTKAKPILTGLAVSPGIASGLVRIVHKIEDIAKVNEGDILVTEMTSPDLVPTMSKSVAIITDKGGSTSHAAIVSREMGIPCITGTEQATNLLKDGQKITVDAYNGMIYEGFIQLKKPKKEDLKLKTKTAIKVNLAFAKDLQRIAEQSDGVGLLRIEHMIAETGVHPAKLIKEGKSKEYTSLLVKGIKPIAEAFKPKPVWVRTLDARSDEFRNLKGGEKEPEESNPMLGWHGIRRSLDEPELLKAEYRAVRELHESGLTNVHVMLPFIISVEEFRRAKKLAKRFLPKTTKLGIMVELPSTALIIEEFCKAGIDFASVGSNDLIMLTLGVDRNNEHIAKLYSEFHPAVLELIENVVKVCKKYKIESSLCGESGSNPEMAKKLVKFGIKSISCNIDALMKVRKAVSKAESD